MDKALLFPEMAQEMPPLSAPANQARRLQSISGDYIANFISTQEEQNLLDNINAGPWLHDLRRRVQHYGYRYNYKERAINSEDYIGALPSWANFVLDRLMAERIFQKRPDQMIINEYEPGQGIAPHTDRACFGPILASLSLGGACLMHLTPATKEAAKEDFDIILEPRSLVIYTGESRYDWKHSIAARRKDKFGDAFYDRTLRVSLTFRTVPLTAP